MVKSLETSTPPAPNAQREKLICIARAQFAAKGYAATTTRAINREMGSAEGLMYYYFPHGKQELLRAIVHEGVTNRLNQVQFDFTGIQTKAEFKRRLQRVFDRLAKLFEDQASYESFIITIRERHLLAGDESSWLSQVLSKMAEALTAALAAADNRLQVTNADCKGFAQIKLAIFQKVIYDELLIKNRRHISSQAKATISPALDLLMNLVQV